MITSIPVLCYGRKDASYNVSMFLKFASLKNLLKCSLHSIFDICWLCASFRTKGSLTWVQTEKTLRNNVRSVLPLDESQNSTQKKLSARDHHTHGSSPLDLMQSRQPS